MDDGGGTVISSHLDKDDVIAIWEVQGSSAGGRMIQVDVRPDGTIEEVELEVGAGEVPPRAGCPRTICARFYAAHRKHEYRKEYPPQRARASGVWYVFSGTTFDVDIGSDGRAVISEPA